MNCVLYSGECSDSKQRKKYIRKAQTIKSPVRELRKLLTLKNGKVFRKKVSERKRAGLRSINVNMNDEIFVITVSADDAGIKGGVIMAIIKKTKQEP